MAHVRKRSKTGTYELIIRSKLLPRPLSFTFDSEEAAIEYGKQCDAYLKAGVIPPKLAELINEKEEKKILLKEIIISWLNNSSPSKSDRDLVGYIIDILPNSLITDINYKWVDSWVSSLKTDRNLAPSSIRKRVQVLRKLLDWYNRESDDFSKANPFAMLPRGYSTYSEKEENIVKAIGKQIKVDQERDRRLSVDEDLRIQAVLRGEKRYDRERPYTKDHNFEMLYYLILHTGVRLKEAYQIKIENVNLASKFIKVQKSKQRRGKIAFREVPILPALYDKLIKYMESLDSDRELLFPFWNGREDGLVKTSRNLSARFKGLFGYANVPNFREHDLRHEATCRWFELKTSKGEWALRTEEIHKIMGWSNSSAMSLRYASFRGKDISERIWGEIS